MWVNHVLNVGNQLLTEDFVTHAVMMDLMKDHTFAMGVFKMSEQQCEQPTIQVGMTVGYWNQACPYHEGIIVEIKNRNPGSYMLFGRNGIEPINQEAIVIYPDNWYKTEVPFNDLHYHDHAGHRLVETEPLSQQEVDAVVAEYERMQPILRAQEEQARKEKAEADEQQRNQFKNDYPYLTQADNCDFSSWSLGAKNLKKELQTTFPEVNFSVKSESYSGGSSIHVSWHNGPSDSVVEKIANKYQYGWFDGMDDLYNYSDQVWTDVFGGAKYVMCNRKISDEIYEQVAKTICKIENKEFKGLEDCPEEKPYHNWYQILNRFFQGVDLTNFTGVEETDCTCGTWPNEFYQVVQGDN